MIILYDKSKTSGFDRNDLVLRNVSKCEVTWEKNGEYQIDLVYNIIPGDNTWKSIVKGAIVKCPVPFQDDQLFRLQSPKKLIDSSSGDESLEVTGYHITYDLNNNFLEDVRPTGKTGVEAGQYLLANTQYSHPFSWIGDITTIGTAYYIRKNVMDAILGDDDNSYLNVWGGELVRDNFNIGMYSQAGENRGIVFKHGKNILGVDWEGDDSNLMTRAMPVIGQDDTSDSSTATTTNTDTMPDGSTISPVIKLPEKYVDSPLINNYEQPYIKEVQVTLTDAQKNLSLDQKYQIMRDYINNMYENERVDVPVYSCTVNFLLLQDTEEYKNYAILETVRPYDLITLRVMDIDVTAELVGYTYDSLTKQYEQITLGNIQNDILRHTQKTLFQMSQNNQNSIKILKAQMEDIPGTILNVATSTTSGGNNLFDHSVLDNNYLSEWTASGATVTTDNTLHDTDKVWEIPHGASVTKEDIILNPDTYKGQQLTFSLSAKYSGLSTTYSDGVGVMTSAKLGSINIQYKKCLADSNAGHWQLKSDGTGIISDYIPIDSSKAFTVTNTSGYTYKLFAYDSNYNYPEEFTSSTSTPNARFMKVEINKSGLTPEQITGFNIYETVERAFSDVAYLYADSVSSDWKNCSTTFTLGTGNSSDVITHVNFTAENQDSSGTIYIGAFMLNTGTVRSDFSQSSNDTIETLRAHQIYCDYIEANKADINELHATNATVQNLSATYATITNLNAVSANISDLKASVGNIMDLTTNTLKSNIIDTAQLKAGCITADSGIIGTGAVNTAQIADGSITDGKIVGLTANKITAGTIDASKITVTNLDCANLTVGTINGKQIAPGAITATQLANGAVGTSQLTNDINNSIQTAYSASQTASQNAQTALNTANGKSTVYYGSTTPTSPVNGDLWMESVNGGISPMQYNGSNWTSVTDVAVANAETASTNAQNVANNAQISATNALNTVNNIQIGVANLWVGTQKYDVFNDARWVDNNDGTSRPTAYWGNGGTWNGFNVLKITSAWVDASQRVNLQPNTNYTLSAWIQSVSSSALATVNGYVNPGSSIISQNFTQGQTVPSGTWTRYYYTFNSGSATTSTCRFEDSTGNAYLICGLKLELGNKVTDWCPSLADTKDAGYLTTGTLLADRIASNSITGTKIAGNTITAGNLVAGTLTSSSGVFGTVDANILTTGTLNASRIATGSIDATKLVAGCITSASGVIGALDAGTITTGTLNTNRIASNSITTDKLLIGDGTNLAVVNETTGAIASNNTYSSNIISGGYVTRSDNSVPYLMVTNKSVIPFKPNEQLYFDFYAVSDVSVNGNFTVWLYDANGSYITEADSGNFNIGTTESEITGYVTVPNFNISTTFIFVAGINNISNRSIKIRKVFVRRVTGSTLIQDGAITTSKIVSSAITTDKIAAGAVRASNILSNTITANQIAGQTITATQIASRTITADRIVTGAITANEIASKTITTNQIASNTIVAGNIQAGTLTSASGVFGVISAGNITTGTLNASLVNVTNLNASNITSGTMSASHISGGTLTLGGGSNGNGLSIVNNSSGKEIVRQDNNGLTITMQQNGEYLNSAFKIQSYTGQTLMNIDDSGALYYYGVMQLQSLADSTRNLTFDPNGTISFDAGTSGRNAFGLGTGDGANFSTYDMELSCWWGLAFGSSAPYDGTNAYKPKIIFDCRSGDITTQGNYKFSNGQYATPTNNVNYFGWGSGSFLACNINGGPNLGINTWQSDISLKRNVKDSTEDALNKLCSIPMRQFDWKDGRGHQKLGLVSQEAMQIDSAFAFGVTQPDGSKIYQPDETILIPYTIKSIQQLNNNNLALEQRIATLEATVKDLQDEITELQNKIPV